MPLRLFMRALDHLEEILIATLIAAATVLIFVAVIQRYGLSNSINVAHWGRAHGYEGLSMREIVSSRAVEGIAMIGLPFLARAAPRTKSTWPPKPE